MKWGFFFPSLELKVVRFSVNLLEGLPRDRGLYIGDVVLTKVNLWSSKQSKDGA